MPTHNLPQIHHQPTISQCLSSLNRAFCHFLCEFRGRNFRSDSSNSDDSSDSDSAEETEIVGEAGLIAKQKLKLSKKTTDKAGEVHMTVYVPHEQSEENDEGEQEEETPKRRMVEQVFLEGEEEKTQK